MFPEFERDNIDFSKMRQEDREAFANIEGKIVRNREKSFKAELEGRIKFTASQTLEACSIAYRLGFIHEETTLVNRMFADKIKADLENSYDERIKAKKEFSKLVGRSSKIISFYGKESIIEEEFNRIVAAAEYFGNISSRLFPFIPKSNDLLKLK